MTRLLAGLIVFALASPRAWGHAEDKNWGDKQTAKKPAAFNLKEKEGKFQPEKEKIAPMKSDGRNSAAAPGTLPSSR